MLRIVIKQQNACFRIPQMGNPILTYPLAPPSTVFGLLRYITSYQSMNKDNTKIAISGIYESKLRHIITNHITGVSDDGKYKSNILSTEELYNVIHIIHIESNDEFEKSIKNNINKFIRFGRREDLINEITIDSTEKYDMCYEDLDDFSKIKNLDFYLYLPFDVLKDNDKFNSLAIFNIPLDSDKSLLDKGYLKMFYKKVFFLKLKVKTIIDKSQYFNSDKEGYIYVWIN